MVTDNKRAQSMSLTTILIMVLGVVVVVLLIWGFSSGWGSFWNTINPFASGGNVDSVRSACSLACSKGVSGKYDFCESPRTVKLADGKSLKGSCSNFVTDSRVGVASCSIECGTNEYKQTCKDLGGEWKGSSDMIGTLSCGDKTVLTDKVKSEADKNANTGKVCCEK